MDTSKELDKLFQEMQHVDRSHEARRNSLIKINNKLSKKKQRVTPIFISIVMIVGCFFLVFSLINQTLNNNEAGIIGKESNNSVKAIQTVIKKEFTAPDKEYINLYEEVSKKELQDRNELATKEREAVHRYAEEKYKAYFTENGFMNFINSTPAFFYQREGINYKLQVENLKINQEKDHPTIYRFTFKVKLEEENGETSSYDFKGEAICPEDGKIGKIMFSDGTGALSSKLMEIANEK